VVFQSFELIPNLPLLHNVMLPAEFAGKLGLRRRRDRALALLDQMEIAEHANKPPSAISGGQQQRVAVARALINDPPVIVADEPTGSLDSATAQAVVRVLRTLAEEGHAVITVTHDPDIAASADRLITLVDGQVTEDRRLGDEDGGM
jgi:putative ABC transport system ATP-binding protein